jgi:hypothetical protein
MWNHSVNHPDPRHRQSSLADAHLTERRRCGTSRERAKPKLISTMSMVIVGNGQQSRTGGSLSATGEQERRHQRSQNRILCELFRFEELDSSESHRDVTNSSSQEYVDRRTQCCGASFYICTAPGLSLPRNAHLNLSISLRPMNVPQGSKPSQQASLPISRLAGASSQLLASSLRDSMKTLTGR